MRLQQIIDHLAAVVDDMNDNSEHDLAFKAQAAIVAVDAVQRACADYGSMIPIWSGTGRLPAEALSMAEIPPFDMNAPMDAPIRAREARERQERERAMKALQDPVVQAKIAEIVGKAWAAMERKVCEHYGKKINCPLCSPQSDAKCKQ